MPAAKIKGAAVKSLIDWYRRTRGVEAHRALFATLPEEDRAVLGGDPPEVLANVWYDVRIAHHLLERVLGPFEGAEQARVAREGARAGLKIASSGVYQFAIRQIISPSFYARHIQRLFRMLHDTGDRRIDMGDGEALSITSNWAGHHPLLCLLANETMAAVFETLGLKDVTVERTRCVSEGAADCRCRVRWTT